MDYGVSHEQGPDITRLNLMPDNEKENKGNSKLPNIPGRNKQGQNGQGSDKNGRSNRPRIPPWVIAVLFLGLVAYQLYAISDPKRDTQSITVPYSVVEQQITSGNVAQVTLTDTAIQANLKDPISWDRRETPHPFKNAGRGIGGVSEGKHATIFGLSHLRDTLSKIGALVVPTLLGLGPAPDIFDAEGNPTESNIQWKVGQVVRELTHFSRGGI